MMIIGIAALCVSAGAASAQSLEEQLAASPGVTEPSKVASLDESAKLVIAEADLYVDKASESFAKGERAKAERALKKASGVMTSNLDRTGSQVIKEVYLSSKKLEELGRQVANGEIKDAQELETALDKFYRSIFDVKEAAGAIPNWGVEMDPSDKEAKE
jgi:hypothetical protein